MLVPVVCITCGLPIGDVEDIFNLLRARRVKEIADKHDIAPSQVSIEVGIKVECEDILERLGIEHDCCRMHLVTAMAFSDYY